MAKTASSSSDFGTMFKKLEETLGEYNDKAPQLPKSVKDIIVKFAPYLAILSVVLGIPGVLALLGLGAFMAPLGLVGGIITGHPFAGFSYMINVVFLGIMIVLEALAIPGLFSRSKKAWTLLYWGALVGVVQNIFALNLWGVVIGGAISMYFLFQVKEYYK